ncbi:MAG: c-type cytochrome [Pseudomonadota bacterium]
MKNSVLIITLTAAVLLTACGKDEETAVTPAPAPASEQPAPPSPPPAPAPAPEAAAPAPQAPAATPSAQPPAEPQSAAPPSEQPAAQAGAALSLEEGRALAQTSGCFACHDKKFERQIIGPNWRDVSKKYKDNPDAHNILVKWIHTGGTGRWGAAVMPPYSPRVPDEDIEKLATFILSLEPSP